MGEQPIGHVFVHGGRRGQHPGSDVGHTDYLEQALDGAVLAKRAMQHGKHNIEAQVGGALSQRAVRNRERDRVAGGHQGPGRSVDEVPPAGRVDSDQGDVVAGFRRTSRPRWPPTRKKPHVRRISHRKGLVPQA